MGLVTLVILGVVVLIALGYWLVGMSRRPPTE